MVATTSNLGLSVYDTTSGSATTFLAFRLAVAGNSSNMSIIDDWAGTISGSVSSLESNTIYNVSASEVSTNYYEASVVSITGYISGMMINLTLSTDITGSTTININSLGNVILKKINASGNKVNLASGDMRDGRYYFFIYDGTNFVLMGATIADQTNIAGTVDNFVSIDTTGVPEDSGVPKLTGVTSGSYTKVQVNSYGQITSGSLADENYIKCSDTKTQNTDGGTFTSGDWRTRAINTEDFDTNNLMTISGSQIKLNYPGIYYCMISVPAYEVDRHQAKLYNISDASDELFGTSEIAISGSGGFSRSIISGKLDLSSGSKIFEIRHQCETTKTTDGFGSACNFASEIYTVAEFWKRQ